MCGGGGTTTSVSCTKPPACVLQAYQNAVSRMNEAANQPFVAYGQTPCAYVAGLSSSQKAGMQNINSLMGSATNCVQGGQNYLMQGANQGIGLQNQSLCLANQGLGMASGINMNALQGICAAKAQGQQYLGGATCLTANAIRTGNAYAGQAQPFYTGALQASAPMTAASQQFIGAGTQNINPTAVLPAVSAFENPYTRCVVNATQRAMAQQNAQQASNLQGCAIMKGAYGGCRAGIAQANLAYEQNLANQQTLANLYCKNYSQALNAAQQQQGVCLSAQQANRAAQQVGAQQTASLAQQQYNQVMGVGTGLSALGQQQYGQNLGTGAQLNTLGNTGYSQGIGAAQAQAGIGQNIFGNTAQTAGLYQGAGNNITNTSLNAGNAYASLGMQNQQLQLANANAQMQAGLVCQQTEQAKKTAGYNTFQQQQGYPFQTASAVANTAEATGAASGSTSTGTSHTSSGFAAGGAVNRPGKYYGGGLGASSQGGAVFNPGAYARGGLSTGGRPSFAGGGWTQVGNDNCGVPQWQNSETGQSFSGYNAPTGCCSVATPAATPATSAIGTDANSLSQGLGTAMPATTSAGTTTGATTTPATTPAITPATTSAGTTTGATTTPNNYADMINNAYAGLGRSGIGTAANNIDQAGYDYWMNQLQSGAITPDQFQTKFMQGANTAFATDPNNPSVQYAKNYLAATNPSAITSGTTTGNTTNSTTVAPICANVAYYNMQKYNPNSTTNGFNPAGFKPVLCGDVVKYQCPNNPSVSYTSAQLASMTGAPPCITALKGGANMVYNPSLYQKPGCATTNQYGFASGNAAGVGNLPANKANAAYRPTNTQCAFLSGLGNLFNSYQPQQQNTYMPNFNFGSACTANSMGAGAYGALPTANLKGTSSMAGGYSPYATQQYTQQQYQAPAQQQYQAYAPQQPMYNGYCGSYQQPNYGMRSSATYGQPSPAYNATGYGQQPSGGPIALATEQATGNYSGGASGQYSGNWADSANTQNAQMATTGQTAVPGASTAKPFANGGRAGFALAGAVGCASQYGCDRAARMALGAINPYAAAPNAGGGYASSIPQQYIPRYGLQAVAPPTPQKQASGLATLMQMPQQAVGAIEGVQKLGTAGKDAYKWATTSSDTTGKARGGRMGFATTGSVPCCCSYVTNRTNFGDYGSQPYGAAGAAGSPQVPNSKSGYVMPGLAPNPWSHIQPLKPASLPAAPTPQNPLKTVANMAGQAKTLANLPNDISQMKTGLGNLFGGSQASNAATLDNALGSGFSANNISLGGAGASAGVPGAASTGLGAAGSAAPVAETATAAAAPVAEAGLGTIGAEAAAPAIASSLAPEVLAGAAAPEAAGKGIAALAPLVFAARGGAIHGYADGGLVGRKGYATPNTGAVDGDISTADIGDGSNAPTTQPDHDREMAIRTMAAEMSGKSWPEAVGIGSVINNRRQSGDYGDSYENVVKSKGEFEPWMLPSSDSNYPMNISPNDPRYQIAAAALPIAEQGYDVTGGAQHFYAPGAQQKLGRNMPSWDKGPSLMLGPTKFVGGVPENRMDAPDAPENIVSLIGKPSSGSAMSYAPSSATAPAMQAINSIMSGGKDAASGISDAASGVGDWFTQNKSWILPILSGLGAAGQASGQGMGRGSSLLSGLGGFATQYGNMAYQQSQITKNNMDLFNQNVMHTRENGKDVFTDRFGNNLSQGQVSQIWSQITGTNPALKGIAGTPAPIVPANATQEQIESAKGAPVIGQTGQPQPSAAPTTISQQPQTSATPAPTQPEIAKSNDSPGAIEPITEAQKIRDSVLQDPRWDSDMYKNDMSNNPKLLFQKYNEFQQKAAQQLQIAQENAKISNTSNPAAVNLARNSEAQAAQYKSQADDALKQANYLMDKYSSGKLTALDKTIADRQNQASKYDDTLRDANADANREKTIQMQLSDVLGKQQFGPGTELWKNLETYYGAVPGVKNMLNYITDNGYNDWSNASDDVKKKVQNWIIQGVASTGTQRAPAASMQHLEQTIPDVNMNTGAAYDVVSNRRALSLMNQDMAKDWAEVERVRTVPNVQAWERAWLADQSHSIDNYLHTAKMQMPAFKGMTDEDIRRYGLKINDANEVKQLPSGAKFLITSGPSKGKIGQAP